MLIGIVAILISLLIVPIVCKWFRIPSIVGMIAAGILLGPHGLGVIAQSDTMTVMSKIGMLYLMFLSGAEIDRQDFRRARYKSLVFGLYTFFFPFTLGLIASRLLFSFSWQTSLLMASMFGSHTLMTYPIASRYGLQKNTAVNFTIGGTLYAITLSLLLLGMISNKSGNLSAADFVRTLAYIALFIGLVMGAFPRLTSWFIKRVNNPQLEFIWVISLVAIASWIADLAGLESILGAFLAGVALNRRIPNLSPLMNRLNFIGNTIFIPLFLLSVGMLINLSDMTGGWFVWGVALAMIVIKLSGKWLAALTAQLSWSLSVSNRRLIFGLSSASAAGTLAVVQIGYEQGIFSTDILHAAVILILFSCIVASYITEYAARDLSMQDIFESKADGSRIEALISISNPQTNTHLVDIAMLTTPHLPSAKFSLLAVRQPKTENSDNQQLLEQTAHYAIAAGIMVQQRQQVAANVANCISEVAHHINATKIVAGIPDNTDNFGIVVPQLLQQAGTSLFLYRQRQPLNTIERIVAIIPCYAEKEIGFLSCFEQIRTLAAQTGAEVVFYANRASIETLRALTRREKKHLAAQFRLIIDFSEVESIAHRLRENDMLVFIQARAATVSYSPQFKTLPRLLQKTFNTQNILIIYPEQTGIEQTALFYEEPQENDIVSLAQKIAKHQQKQL